MSSCVPRRAEFVLDTVSSSRLFFERELDIMSSLSGLKENIDMATAQASPAAPSQGWRTLNNRHTGECLQLRRIVRDGTMCLELRGTLPPRQDGPPLHVHYYEHEEGTVVAGTLSAEVDGRQLQVEAGGTAVLPAGSVERRRRDSRTRRPGQARRRSRRVLCGCVRGAQQRSGEPAAALLHRPPCLEASQDAGGPFRTAVGAGYRRAAHCVGRHDPRTLSRYRVARVSGPVRTGPRR